MLFYDSESILASGTFQSSTLVSDSAKPYVYIEKKLVQAGAPFLGTGIKILKRSAAFEEVDNS